MASPPLEDIMSTNVYGVTDEEVVSAVAQEMVNRRIGSAVVKRGTLLLGILTERDVLRAAASAIDLTTSLISDWMTPNPVTAAATTTADEAAAIMLSNGFRHLPVLENNRVIGMVSLRDVLSTRIGR